MTIEMIEGDCREILRELPDQSVHCIVTSPPYFGLRDYGVDGQMGLEPTPDEFVAALVGVLREARRVLRDDGTLWLNLGDSYATSGGAGGQGATGQRASRTFTADGTLKKSNAADIKPKDLIGIPWRVAFALQADGWYLRQDIIWHKPNPMPESVTDRCTKAHEYIFLLSKSPKYYFDAEAIKEQASDNTHSRRAKNGVVRITEKTAAATFNVKNNASMSQAISGEILPYRNKRSVWTVLPKPFKEAHFATFPPDLIEPCILAGCPVGGTVLDPFFGAGTTGLVCQKLDRDCIGIELSPTYFDIAAKRLGLDQPLQAAE